ncbi:MAG: hypothetical protein VB032_00220, partial [Burkholderiaceae bacterium]|nr:hypothetical protein [Burkholderiaceae bacterium]
LNDDGQTEIVRWIESVGKLDDQLSPYAWYALAEEAAAANQPEEPIVIEMLPTYTLSGESETLELCRMSHFDWSIEAVPLEFIQNAEELLDTGVPVRFLLLAETAGETFSKHVGEWCRELEAYETQLLLSAINVFFQALCDEAGMVLDEALLFPVDDDIDWPDVEPAQLNAAIEESIDAARDALLSLDPELGATLPATQELVERLWFKRAS